MKLSVLFLICSLSMTYAAESYAQKTMISLEDVMKQLALCWKS